MAKNSKSKGKMNMSEVEGSASHAIINWWNTYNFFDSSPKQIYDDVIGILPEDRINEPKVQNFLKNLLKARNGQQSSVIIGNFILSGDNEGILMVNKPGR